LPNPTRFAFSHFKSFFISSSDQSGARTNSSEELFPLDLLSVNFGHKVRIGRKFCLTLIQ
jgi:hypothetical protein